MIIQEQKVESNFDSQDFKIKASAKAFKILSSNLYKDKILAICRELICNAYDSHVQVGKKDVPVVVTVPTAANPNFIVEDFGLGLSKEEVEQIYTTYFESTKTETNELIGGLGLGSKSPFAYTTSFTVIATKDEVQNTFVAFIGDGGLPQISLLVTQPVPGKSNGVRVEVPVQSSDYYLFRDSLAKLQWFETVPEVIGNSGITQHHLFKQLNEYGFATEVSYKRNRMAVMGNIAYPISIDHIENANRMMSKIISLTSYDINIYLKFDIGELDIAPSREELSYDKKTQEVILNKLVWLYSQLEQQYKEITSDESLSLSERVLKLSQVGFRTAIHDFIEEYCKQHTPKDMDLFSRIYKIDSCWSKKIDSENVNLAIHGNYHVHTYLYNLIIENVLFVNCPSGKSISRIARDVLGEYKVSTVVEVFDITPEQTSYIKHIFGVDVHELSDVRRKIREDKPKVEREQKQYSGDRIVVEGNEMLLSTKDPKTTKFITNECYLSFYSTLYPDVDIHKVSKIYIGKIENNGFEVLNCSRSKTYTPDEVKMIMGHIAETMTKEEFEYIVATVAIYSGRIDFNYNDRDTPTWFKFNSLFELYKKEIMSVIDIPDNFIYNTKSGKTHISIDVKCAIAQLYDEPLTTKLKAITEATPVLYLVNRCSSPADIEIVLNLLKKA